MKQLTEAYWKLFIQGNIPKLKERLSIDIEGKYSSIEFFDFILKNNYSLFMPVFFSYYNVVKYIKYNEWQIIFNSLCETIDKHPAAIDSFITFFYTYIKVDFLYILANKSIEHTVIKYGILKGFVRNPGLLSLKDEFIVNELEKYDIRYEDLLKNRKTLLKDGAFLASPIKLEYVYKNNIKISYMKGKCPEDWDWAKYFR